MFRQQKRIDIFVGDQQFEEESPPRTNTHLTSSILNLLRKKPKKKELNMKRVKSANTLSLQMSAFDSEESNTSHRFLTVPNEHLQDVKQTKNRNILGKLLPRTKSMPVIAKHPSDFEDENSKPNAKKKLTQEGQKKLHDLVEYLHTDTPIVAFKQVLDRDDVELMSALDHNVDLDKYFEEEKMESPINIWKNKSKFSSEVPSSPRSRKSSESLHIEDELSPNGYRLVRRFGYGIPDGCGFPLSLKREDSVNCGRNWQNIMEEAETTLCKFENVNRGVQKGSLFQPRLIFISPHPKTGWDKVSQTGHCLPLRKWTSELLFESKEAALLLDDEVKRHFKWNASVSDFRHLFSGDNFRSEQKSEESVATRKDSSIAFRRRSYNEKVWDRRNIMSKRKNDYNEKLKMFRCRKWDASNLRTLEESRRTLNGKRRRLKSIFLNNDFDLKTFSEVNLLAPKTIAAELTLIVKEIFLNINATELCRLFWQPHFVDQESCPDIAALLGFQKRIVNLITTTVLQHLTVEERAKKIAHFIEVAEELRHLRNWHSVFSVINSLQSPPIARLRNTWNLLSEEYEEHFYEFVVLSETLEKEKFDEQIEYTAPFIPLFDDWLRDLKSRCVLKVDALKKKNIRGHWERPENIASWLNTEISAVEQLAVDGNCSKKFADKNDRKLKKKKKGLFGRLKHFSLKSETPTKVESEKVQICRPGVCSRTPCVQTHNILTNNHSTDKSEECFLIDIPKLEEEDEKEILKEISKVLEEYQNKASLYQINSENIIARNYLLLQSYDTMDTNMAKSFKLEPPQNMESIKL